MRFRFLNWPLGLCLLLAACDRGGPGGTPVFRNAPVVLISIDTLRSDRLPAYGYRKVETPALDALRRDSILFERAYSQIPLTLPSHVSILTGRLPGDHSVRDNVGYRYDGEKVPGLPGLLHAAGYATGGAVSAYVLRSDTGIGHGFDAYDDGIKVRFNESLGSSQRPGGEASTAALSWVRTTIADQSDKPFFLFLHLYEPHTPYTPPSPFAAKYAADPYDGEIAAADAIVGSFLDELKSLGLYDKAVIILLSDHGEGLGDHGEKEHGILLYREALQVPLFLKLPGGKRGGESVAAPVELIDVFPTVLALTGVEAPDGKDAEATPGRSLLAPAGDAPRDLYAETWYPRLHFGWSELSSVIRDRFHYIEGPDPELYDLAGDPRETKNVLGAERRAYAMLRKAAAGSKRELQAPAAVDPETAARLAALGYAGGTVRVGAGDELPDPKSRIADLPELERALGLVARQGFRDALPILRRLVAANPNMVEAWENLGLTLQKLGQHEEALAAYQKALEGSGGAPHIALAASSLLLQMGRLDDARSHAELGLAVSPAMANSLLAQVALAQNRLDDAERAARAALAAPGPRLAPLLTLAQVLQKRENLDEALRTVDEADAELAKTGAAGQTFAGLGFVRGDILARLGRNAEAEQAFLREIRDFPADTRSWANLAMLYASQGKSEEALAVLQRLVESNGSPAAYAEAVRTLRILGDPQGAAALLRHGRAVHPDSKELQALGG